MIRLFLIEWIKLRNYRAFQVLIGLYFLIVGIVCSSGMLLLEYFKNKGIKFKDVDPTILPIYEFPYVWNNIAFVAARLKIILAFILIISLTNEITYKTLRQNIIDGMSRIEFMLSKLSMIFVLSAANVVFIFISGLINGLIYSGNKSLGAIFGNMEYLGALFLNVFCFLIFTFLIATLIKRTGIVIIFLGIYATIIEPVVTIIFSNAPLPGIFAKLSPFFPRQAITNLIPDPFPQYVFHEIQESILFTDVSIAVFEMFVFIGLIYFILKRKSNI